MRAGQLETTTPAEEPPANGDRAGAERIAT
jgi:hypothetical protein